MGLSSSQARLLNLTARMHQIEYKAAKLEAQKLQMANESTRVYEDYLEALDKTKVQYKVLTTDGSVTYRDIQQYSDFTGAGYALHYKGITFDGQTKYKEGSDGNFYKTGATLPNGVTLQGAEKTANWDTLLVELGINKVSGDFEKVITNIINSGEVTIVAKGNETEFRQGTDADFADYETSISTNTGLQEVSDEVELRKAEAKYEADMKKIDNKDRKFDTDLAALDTERNAIKQEMETLKTVAKENVERTFKLFS